MSSGRQVADLLQSRMVKREPVERSHQSHGRFGSSNPAVLAPLALNQRNASIAIDLEPESRWLTEEDCPIPRVDIRKPGAARPVWRWRVRDLERFLLDRLVDPGKDSPLASNSAT
jgi:hypothetical protein